MAAHLRVDLGSDRDVNLVRLCDEYEAVGHEDYRTALTAVAAYVAVEARWKKMPELEDAVEIAWLEEYIHQAFGFIHREDRWSLPDPDKARCREQAEAALRGQVVTAKEQSDRQLAVMTAAVGVGLGLVFWELMLAGAAVVAAAKLIKNLFVGSHMKRLAPATLVLLHIRKREEYEELLRAEQEAAA